MIIVVIVIVEFGEIWPMESVPLALAASLAVSSLVLVCVLSLLLPLQLLAAAARRSLQKGDDFR